MIWFLMALGVLSFLMLLYIPIAIYNLVKKKKDKLIRSIILPILSISYIIFALQNSDSWFEELDLQNKLDEEARLEKEKKEVTVFNKNLLAKKTEEGCYQTRLLNLEEPHYQPRNTKSKFRKYYEDWDFFCPDSVQIPEAIYLNCDWAGLITHNRNVGNTTIIFKPFLDKNRENVDTILVEVEIEKDLQEHRISKNFMPFITENEREWNITEKEGNETRVISYWEGGPAPRSSYYLDRLNLTLTVKTDHGKDAYDRFTESTFHCKKINYQIFLDNLKKDLKNGSTFIRKEINSEDKKKELEEQRVKKEKDRFKL